MTIFYFYLVSVLAIAVVVGVLSLGLRALQRHADRQKSTGEAENAEVVEGVLTDIAKDIKEKARGVTVRACQPPPPGTRCRSHKRCGALATDALYVWNEWGMSASWHYYCRSCADKWEKAMQGMWFGTARMHFEGAKWVCVMEDSNV